MTLSLHLRVSSGPPNNNKTYAFLWAPRSPFPALGERLLGTALCVIVDATENTLRGATIRGLLAPMANSLNNVSGVLLSAPF